MVNPFWAQCTFNQYLIEAWKNSRTFFNSFNFLLLLADGASSISRWILVIKVGVIGTIWQALWKRANVSVLTNKLELYWVSFTWFCSIFPPQFSRVSFSYISAINCECMNLLLLCWLLKTNGMWHQLHQPFTTSIVVILFFFLLFFFSGDYGRWYNRQLCGVIVLIHISHRT